MASAAMHMVPRSWKEFHSLCEEGPGAFAAGYGGGQVCYQNQSGSFPTILPQLPCDIDRQFPLLCAD